MLGLGDKAAYTLAQERLADRPRIHRLRAKKCHEAREPASQCIRK